MSNTYSITKRDGEIITFSTDLTFDEAFAILRTAVMDGKVRSNFARSLVDQHHRVSMGRGGRRLSEVQRTWLLKLTVDFLAPKPEPKASVKLEGIVALLTEAGAKLKRPAITIEDAAAGTIKLTVAGARSARPGTINVTDGRPYGENKWYGRIDTDGTFESSRQCGEYVEVALAMLNADPAGFAAEHGKRTGSCCFCNRALTTKESTSVGYGPQCAKKWNLPWGVTAVAV